MLDGTFIPSEHEPFIVMKEMITAGNEELYSNQWSVCINPFDSAGGLIVLNYERANRIIKNYNMSKSFTSSAGEIYEIPSRPFLKKYKGLHHNVPKRFD